MPIKHDPSLLADSRLLTEDCIQYVEKATQEKEDNPDEILSAIERENRNEINKRWNERHPETRIEVQKRYNASAKGKISLKIACLKRQIDMANQAIGKKHLRIKMMRDEINTLECKRSLLP